MGDGLDDLSQHALVGIIVSVIGLCVMALVLGIASGHM